MNRSEFVGRKNYPYGILILAAVNVGYFLFLMAVGAVEKTPGMIRWGVLYIEDGKYIGNVVRLLTSMFMHFDIYHLGSNLLMLLVVGDMLESILGAFRVLLVYFVGGLAGNAATVFWCGILKKTVVSAGASGAVFALVGMLCYIGLRNRRQIPGFPKERIFLMVFLMFYSGVVHAEINMAAHIGGFLGGIMCGFFMGGGRKPRKENGESSSFTGR